MPVNSPGHNVTRVPHVGVRTFLPSDCSERRSPGSPAILIISHCATLRRPSPPEHYATSLISPVTPCPPPVFVISGAALGRRAPRCPRGAILGTPFPPRRPRDFLILVQRGRSFLPDSCTGAEDFDVRQRCTDSRLSAEPIEAGIDRWPPKQSALAVARRPPASTRDARAWPEPHTTHSRFDNSCDEDFGGVSPEHNWGVALRSHKDGNAVECKGYDED